MGQENVLIRHNLDTMVQDTSDLTQKEMWPLATHNAEFGTVITTNDVNAEQGNMCYLVYQYKHCFACVPL